MARSLSFNSNRAVPRLDLRIAVLSTLVLVVFAGMLVRLYDLQVLHHAEMAELADRNRIRVLREPAPRGIVFDVRHRPLVDTRPSFDAVIVPEDSYDLSATIEKLEKYLGETGIADKITAADDQDRPPYEPVTVDQRLDWPQVVALETHQLELPGVSLDITPGRHYLYGKLAAHLLGYVGEVDKSDLQLADYHMGDEIGKFGLERGWEPYLRGVAGGQEVEVDSVGRRLRTLKEIPDQPGSSVVLSIDLDVQQVAEQALEGKNGALVAMDPNTGYIIAMVSHPAFDPDVFGAGVKEADWKDLMSDANHPLQNRVIQGVYPPGSTFKIVDSIAGLEESTLNQNTAYSCAGGMWYGGREYHCWRKQGHGTIELHDAIVRSCDVYFYQVGEKLGIDRLSKWATALGFGQKTGIDLDNEKGGTMPSSVWKERRFHERWYPAETLSVAIGQGYVAVTPMQLAQFASEVANGGTRYKPQFVKQVEALDGSIARSYPPIVEGRVNLDPAYDAIVRDAMGDVVNTPWGTATKCKLPGITVCGKTGTAQVVGDKGSFSAGEDEDKIPEQYRDHAWFIAFAPKEHPTIAVACIVEHGGHGGSAAAPAVHDVMQRFFQNNPPPAASQPEMATNAAAPAIARILAD
ncbi:MAG TPA: penicillin-binding protein 2, partial [Candidatus Binataceae bacterium]|nr:penicillin-binding protein 2 [Candidatus Binataceae bacterium]